MSNIIFLVDDNAVSLNAGKMVLQGNYTVVTIPSGAELLLILEKIKPDLILLDTEMPGLDGYETIKALKSNGKTKDIPVIFLTKQTKPKHEFFWFSLGAVDFITKPFSPPRLLKQVELHLLLQSQKNELRKYKER